MIVVTANSNPVFTVSFVLRRLLSTSTSAASSSVASSASAATTRPKIARVGGIRTDGRTTKWYQRASVERVEGAAASQQFTVKLDGRELLTPADRTLRVPSYALALIIAAEWEKQTQRVLPHTMPMMTMCTTVLDEVPGKRAVIVANLLSFLRSDTACIWHPEPDIAKIQERDLTPVVQWFQREFNVPLTLNGSFAAQDQPEDTITVLQWQMFKFDDWTLAALETMTQTLKSLVLAMAVARGRLTAEDAMKFSYTEELYNRNRWGRFEGHGGHDVDEADSLQRLAAPAAMLRLVKSHINAD
jgi:ATP synthase F1 complex assembly factor 2